MEQQRVISLRMERQCLSHKADVSEYISLFQDTQPGQNVYWNGFGDPPSLTLRADFDDLAFNRQRQKERALLKGRFQGGNLGWVMAEDWELFACVYCKPLSRFTEPQKKLMEVISREGPLNIQQMKQETGMLVKEITPALHRLQQAFLIYEDQYDGDWERGWYPFSSMFPQVSLNRYSRTQALSLLLKRFAYRNVVFDEAMAKSFYKLPAKEISQALAKLTEEGTLVAREGGYLLSSDCSLLDSDTSGFSPSVYALHRNDFLVKSNDHWLKESFRHPVHDTLQYLLIDGVFHGASVGRFRNGPYDLEDVITDLPPKEAEQRKEEILRAVSDVNGGRRPTLFLGKSV